MTTISDINVDDTVTATQGDSRITGVVKLNHGGTKYLDLPGLRGYDVSLSLPVLERKGYTFAVKKRATPAIPTEPGHYADRNGKPWILTTGTKDHNQPWVAWDGFDHTAASAAFFAPFTPVEAPVALRYRVAKTAGGRYGVLDVTTGDVARFGSFEASVKTAVTELNAGSRRRRDLIWTSKSALFDTYTEVK